MIARTWSGSRVELTWRRLFPWLRGWALGGWTREGRELRAKERRLELEGAAQAEAEASTNGNGAGGHASRLATPGAIGGGTITPKSVVPGGMAADPVNRVVIFRARGPLDIEDTYFVLAFCQLRHLAGQMLQQEAELELQQLGRPAPPRNTAGMPRGKRR